MIIKTKNFFIRPLKISDTKNFFECHSDAVARKNLAFSPTSLKHVIQEIKTKKLVKRYAIISENKFAGFINLRFNNSHFEKHSAVIGYGLHKDFRGKGIGSIAIKKFVDYAFKNLKVKRITAICRTYNKASFKVLKKCGFKLEGVLHKNKFIKGKYVDDFLLAKWK